MHGLCERLLHIFTSKCEVPKLPKYLRSCAVVSISQFAHICTCSPQFQGVSFEPSSICLEKRSSRRGVRRSAAKFTSKATYLLHLQILTVHCDYWFLALQFPAVICFETCLNRLKLGQLNDARLSCVPTFVSNLSSSTIFQHVHNGLQWHIWVPLVHYHLPPPEQLSEVFVKLSLLEREVLLCFTIDFLVRFAFPDYLSTYSRFDAVPNHSHSWHRTSIETEQWDPSGKLHTGSPIGPRLSSRRTTGNGTWKLH